VKTNTTTDDLSAGGPYRYLFLAGATMTYLIITMGGVVCVTGSGQGCPDWPGCYGQIIPPPRIDAIIEFTHRFIAGLTAPVVIAGVIVAWRKFRALPWVAWSSLLGILFMGAVVVFGAFAVLTGLSPLAAVMDISSALLALALMVTAAVVVFRHRAGASLPARPSFNTPFGRLALATLVGTFVVLATAVLVSRSGSVVRCLGWPLYGSGSALADAHDWSQMVRSIVAGVVSLLALATVVQAWRTQRANPPIPAVATLSGALFVAETVIGLVMAARGYSEGLLLAYVPIMAGAYASLVAVAVLAALAVPFPAARPEAAPKQTPSIHPA
jgi:cytochrome c oxidase assembly protein subunit 15